MDGTLWFAIHRTRGLGASSFCRWHIMSSILCKWI